MEIECCCFEQPISNQKIIFAAISLDAHNNNIRLPSQNSASDHNMVYKLSVVKESLWLCVYNRYKFYTSQAVLCQQHCLLWVLSDSTNRHKTCRGPIFTSLLKRSSESQVTPLTFFGPESTFYCRRVKFKSNKFKPVNHCPIMEESFAGLSNMTSAKFYTLSLTWPLLLLLLLVTPSSTRWSMADIINESLSRP